MVYKKLKNIFAISVPIFIVHGIEEYLTGFYNINPLSKFVFQTFDKMPNPQAVFLLFQIMTSLLLVTSFILIAKERWLLWVMIVPGLFYIFEIHHIIEAFMIRNYYPGLITALAFPIIAFLFWKELFKNFRVI